MRNVPCGAFLISFFISAVKGDLHLQNDERAVKANEAEAVQEEKRDAFGQTQAHDDQGHLDFLTSLILIGVSIAVFITCQGYYQQQLKRRIVTTFYESTGFMPTVFAGFLLVLALFLLVGSLRTGSVKAHAARLVSSFKATMVSRKFWKAVGGLVFFGVYVYGLLGKLSFGVASFIVLFVTLMYTHLEKNVKTWVKMMLIALCASGGIVLLFQYAFSVPMP